LATVFCDFMADLTKCGNYDLLLPVAAEIRLPSWSRMRETQNPQAIEDGAHEARQLVSRPLSRPSPTANLVGNWKGDPLIREVRGLKFTPSKTVAAWSRSSWLRCEYL
jgi:hypothetical protein